MDFYELRRLNEAVRMVMESDSMHHYTSGVDDVPNSSGHYPRNATNSLKKAGDAAKKAGMVVSYSTATPGRGKGTSGHSSTLSPKHDLVHISHHDPKAVHKVLASAGHVDHKDHDFTHNYLKSKTHGGHSDSSSEYHRHNEGNRT